MAGERVCARVSQGSGSAHALLLLLVFHSPFYVSVIGSEKHGGLRSRHPPRVRLGHGERKRHSEHESEKGRERGREECLCLSVSVCLCVCVCVLPLPSTNDRCHHVGHQHQLISVISNNRCLQPTSSSSSPSASVAHEYQTCWSSSSASSSATNRCLHA
eukprot:3552064-Rhodomonas_salina.1